MVRTKNIVLQATLLMPVDLVDISLYWSSDHETFWADMKAYTRNKNNTRYKRTGDSLYTSLLFIVSTLKTDRRIDLKYWYQSIVKIFVCVQCVPFKRHIDCISIINRTGIIFNLNLAFDMMNILTKPCVFNTEGLYLRIHLAVDYLTLIVHVFFK